MRVKCKMFSLMWCIRHNRTTINCNSSYQNKLGNGSANLLNTHNRWYVRLNCLQYSITFDSRVIFHSQSGSHISLFISLTSSNMFIRSASISVAMPLAFTIHYQPYLSWSHKSYLIYHQPWLSCHLPGFCPTDFLYYNPIHHLVLAMA